MITLRLADKKVRQEIERLVGFLREAVGTGDRTVLSLSGGVDSSELLPKVEDNNGRDRA
jgi:tRNA(Ile)-lysidine synthase TilS/MesJ